MKLDIIFNRSEDDNGYATFRVGAYNQQPRRNMFLQDISIEEWSKGSDGNLLHYMKADKPLAKACGGTAQASLHLTHTMCARKT